jgi:hypothetical protein
VDADADDDDVRETPDKAAAPFEGSDR